MEEAGLSKWKLGFPSTGQEQPCWEPAHRVPVLIENRAQLLLVGKQRTLLVEGREMRARQGVRNMGMAHSESMKRSKTILHLRGTKNLGRSQGDR